MADNPHSDTLSEGIRVRAQAQYLPDESDPDRPIHVYQYRVVISNEGQGRARLLTRHWVIIDSENERRDVRGHGVTGEFPDLGPGESFEYVSHCPLKTRWGTMEGTYRLVREDGSKFDVRIGRFFLAPQNPPILASSPS